MNPATDNPDTPKRGEAPKASPRASVFDPLRGREVALTPEEEVRQAFVAWLIQKMGYPRAMIANEVTIKLNGMSRRCDTVVYSRQGLRPVMIVEYKAPSVAITRKVFDQIARYNLVLQVPWLVVTNGRSLYCCSADGTFHQSIPPYPG